MVELQNANFTVKKISDHTRDGIRTQSLRFVLANVFPSRFATQGKDSLVLNASVRDGGLIEELRLNTSAHY